MLQVKQQGGMWCFGGALVSASDFGSEDSWFSPRPGMFRVNIFSSELTLCDNSHSCLDILGGEKNAIISAAALMED